ncbi:sulfotransferase family protein [Luteimonas deserti]|uniref:Sulfotransferase n=1 Tax=Luteimonas deserti TaxID=2752306 RepID=A0A7Z0QRL3_9GAMM|nr:sulfotransferase [Luteimonas deserti]NYZ63564.1 sulfotransferase [Luteimonas deserti]
MAAGTGRIDMLRRQGEHALTRRQWNEAVRAFRELVRLHPSDADGWFNLGYGLRHAGKFEEALDAYAQALRADAADPAMIHVNRAVILSDHVGDEAGAEIALRTALALRPEHPIALLNLGNLYEEQGRRGDAVGCYDTLLAAGDTASDASIEALGRMLHLVEPASLDDPRLARLLGVVQRSDVNAHVRANGWFALGHAFERLNATEAALRAFSEGKRWGYSGVAPYDPSAAQAQVEALTQVFDAAVPGHTAVGLLSPEPIFIVGLFRSGSSLLEQVLGCHPDIAAAGELDLLPRLAWRQLAPFPEGARSLTAHAAREHATEYHAALRARLPQARASCRFATDKRPDNYRLIGLIKRLFPAARFVHTVREPRDVALSIYMQHLNPSAFPYAGTLQGIAHEITLHERTMAHWNALYPGDIAAFDYDAFVRAPEATLRPLLAWLGLDWAPECLQFQAAARSVKTASYWQVRQPLHTSASGRWRRYRAHLPGFFDRLR